MHGLVRLRALLKSICLRRTTEILQLPEASDQIRRLELSPAERELYSNVAESHKRRIDEAISSNTSVKNQGLFQAILRLRIFCSNGSTGPAKASSSSSRRKSKKSVVPSHLEEGLCSNCWKEASSIEDMEDSKLGVLTGCSHLLCYDCTEESQQDDCMNRVLCPVCGNLTSTTALQPGVDDDQSSVAPTDYQFTSKMSTLIRDISQYQNSEKG